MRVTSREYKVIVDGSLFAGPANALDIIREDTRDLAKSIGAEAAGSFDAEDPKERTVLFLDTPDFTLQRNGLLLRRRVKRKSGKMEFTLKARTEDRYVAAGADLRPGPGLDSDTKFEEDIGVPFVSRFSHSTTVAAGGGAAGDGLPRTLAAAAELFPGVLTVRRDGLPCPPHTALAPVNGQEAFERVFTGPVVRLVGGDDRPTSAKAVVAVILWTKGEKGRVLTSELSFRYGDEDEAFPPAVAASARRLFAGLQQLDWTRPGGPTKTQYIYGGG
jgi:hypothetical protein